MGRGLDRHLAAVVGASAGGRRHGGGGVRGWCGETSGGGRIGSETTGGVVPRVEAPVAADPAPSCVLLVDVVPISVVVGIAPMSCHVVLTGRPLHGSVMGVALVGHAPSSMKLPGIDPAYQRAVGSL